MDSSNTPSVVDEVLAGDRLSFAAAARAVSPPPPAPPTNSSTLFRWYNKGCAAADGRRVFLEAARVGRRLVTSQAALGRFFAALNEKGGQGSDQAPPAPPAAPQRSRAGRASVAQVKALDDAGM